MKSILSSLVVVLSLLFIPSLYAETVTTVKETTTTYNVVPIDVDPNARTYRVVGDTPMTTTGDYYYTYPGYRCYKEKKVIVGENGLVYRSVSTDGGEIYCYKE